MTISFKNVSFEYAESEAVLTEVNFVINPDSFIGIVGSNGVGKTTVARLMNATLKPTYGKVWVNGLDTSKQNVLPQVKQLGSYIGSDPENQLVTSSVYEEVAFSLQAKHLPPSQIKTKTDEALKLFDLEDYVHSHPFHLSMGQRFRVLLAAAYACEPTYLVLDEVLSMLDSISRESLLIFLKYLKKNRGWGVVLLTHRLEDLIFANEVFVLSEGTIRFKGSLEELFSKNNYFNRWSITTPPLYKVLDKLSMESREKIASLTALPPYTI